MLLPVGELKMNINHGNQRHGRECCLSGLNSAFSKLITIAIWSIINLPAASFTLKQNNNVQF